MIKRITILCISAFLLAGIFGCQPKVRYRALCLLFDGVPTPPGMRPCDGHMPPAGAIAAASEGKEEQAGYVQHGPYAARLCEGCHQRQTNKLIMAKEDLCLNCHELSIKKRIVHGPVASGNCVICHEPHGSGNKYLLVAKSQDFCLYCHSKLDIQKTDVHLNSAETSCTTCHNAHASDNDYLLIASAADGYKAKRQTPPSRAGQPLKERASGSKDGPPATSSELRKDAPPATSSELRPEKKGNKFPTSSGKPPASPGADLKNKVISKLTPTTKNTDRQVDLAEANRDR